MAVPAAPRMIRKILLGICLSCALLVTLAALVLVLQDANEYKPEIEAWLSAQVGSDVRIEGEVNLSVYPWIGLRVERIRIASLPEYGEQPLVSATGAVIRMRLGPLLRDREIVLDRFVLDRPVITLRRLADGRANWHPLLRRFGMMAEHEPPSLVQGPAENPSFMAHSEGWSLKAERMRGVRIVGGRVQYIVDATNETLVVDQLYLETGPGIEFDYELRFRVDESISGLYGVASLEGSCILDPDAPSFATRGATFSFNGSAGYAGEIVTGTVNGKLDMDTAAGRAALRQAVADMDFARVEFSAEAPLPLGSLPVTGDVRFTLRNADIFTRIWREMKDGTALQYLEGFRLRSGYRVEPERILLEGLHVETAGMTAEGRGELLLGENLQASILLDLPAIALDGLAGNGGNSAGWMTALLDAGEPPSLGPLESLRLGMDVGEVTGYGFDLRQLSMDLDISASRVLADINIANAFGGQLGAKFDLAPGNSVVEASAENLELDTLGGVLRQHGVLAEDADIPTGTATVVGRGEAPSLGLLWEQGTLGGAGAITDGSFAVGDQLATSWAGLEFAANRESGGAGGLDAFTMSIAAHDVTGSHGATSVDASFVNASGDGDAVSWRTRDLSVSLKGGIAVGSGGIELRDVQYELAASGKKGVWSLPGSSRLRKGQGELRLTSRGKFSLNPTARRILVKDMRTEGFGLVVTGRGTFDYAEEWSLRGTIGLPEFAPRVFMVHLGIDPPDNIEPGLLSSSRVQTEVEARSGWLRFHNIELHLDESTGQGEFTFSEMRKGEPEWGLSFDLRFNNLDADRYLFGHPHPQHAEPAAPRSVGTWNLDWLKEMRSRGRLRIEALELFDLHYQDVDLTCELRDGTFTLEPFTAGFYNGKLRLGIRGEARETLAMAVDLELEKFNLLGVLEDVGDWDRMGGETSIVMQLKSQGLSSAEHLLSLSGNGDVMVDNGFYAYTREAVKTENEKMLWREMYKNQREGREAADKQEVAEERVVIPVKTARATIQIRNGIFRNEDFIARGDVMTAKGSGTMDIPKAALDYTILVDAKVIPVFPVHIQGPLAAPDVEEGGINFVETLFTTFRNILTIPFSAMDAISRQARQFQEGLMPGQQNTEKDGSESSAQ